MGPITNQPLTPTLYHSILDPPSSIFYPLPCKLSRVLVVVLVVPLGDLPSRRASLARSAQMEAMATAPTPVEAGSIEVRSSVTLTGELGTK
jgi:hypothetical protein